MTTFHKTEVKKKLDMLQVTRDWTEYRNCQNTEIIWVEVKLFSSSSYTSVISIMYSKNHCLTQ